MRLIDVITILCFLVALSVVVFDLISKNEDLLAPLMKNLIH